MSVARLYGGGWDEIGQGGGDSMALSVSDSIHFLW